MHNCQELVFNALTLLVGNMKAHKNLCNFQNSVVATTSRFDCLHYLTLCYGRYLRSTTSRT